MEVGFEFDMEMEMEMETEIQTEAKERRNAPLFFTYHYFFLYFCSTLPGQFIFNGSGGRIQRVEVVVVNSLKGRF